MDFIVLKEAVFKQFDKIKGHELFRTNVNKEQLWSTYLSSFPEGSNPMFRERTQHDCSCCRHFIYDIGNVVANIDGQLVSIWDCKVDDSNYQAVLDKMSQLVTSQPIVNVFLHYEKNVGTNSTFENIDGVVREWNHFHVELPIGKNGEKHFVCRNVDINGKLAECRDSQEMLLRGLKEITQEAIDIVLALIAQNSLVRGAEFKGMVSSFNDIKAEFDSLPEEYHNDFTWLKSREVYASISRIRGTVIGSLLLDLSKEDADVDGAVRSFEVKVEGENYKRPKALEYVTKKMFEDAKNTIEGLGLTSALNRRFASIDDISINDILFANRESKQILTGNIFDELASNVADKKPKNLDKVEEIGIDKFISDVLPTATSIEMMVGNEHVKNLVSLIAPIDPTSGSMFKWDNRFSWSYNGEVADSIKDRVKKAGGNIDADLCCRLSWFNYDDLDIHMVEPPTPGMAGYRICFDSKRYTSPNGGRLDIDMNAGNGDTREAVENIFYKDKSAMREGIYTLYVHNYARRENIDVGFEVEIDFMGKVQKFVYDKAVNNREMILVAEIQYTEKDGIKIINSLPTASISKNVWGIQTETFRNVNVVMMSPNYWEGTGVGNKQYMFMLDGCVNDGSARGFFNEFLKEDFTKHRKVFEIVGGKTKPQLTDSQLSGLGFSSTKRDSILCRVKGSFNRVVKIVF